MARTAPVPNIPAIPGMNPGVFILGGGGAGGGSGGQSGRGHGDGEGANGQNGGNGASGGGADGTGCGTGSPAGCSNCGNTIQVGDPVDIATGRVFTLPAVDVALPGPLPLSIRRTYSSHANGRDVGLGHGWTHSLAWEIEIRRRGVELWDGEGTMLRFELPEVDGYTIGMNGRVLYRFSWGFALLVDGMWRLFGLFGKDTTRHRLFWMEDNNQNKIRLYYRENGELALIEDSVGRIIRVSARNGRTSSFALKNARQGGQWITLAKFVYDERGDLVQVIDGDGYCTRYTYDDEHLLTSFSSTDALTFHFVYDDRRRCVETWGAMPDGTVPGLSTDAPAYLADGRTRAKGILHAKIEYHDDGYREVANSLKVARYDCNNLGLVDKSVAKGAVTTRTFDKDGNILSHTDALGGVTTFERRDGLVVRQTNPLGENLFIDRDEHGRPVEYVDGIGTLLRVSYDERGNIIEFVHALGDVISIKRNARGLPIERIEANGGRITWEYDDHFNVTRVTKPDGSTWKFSYDYLGRLVSHIDACENETRYVWNNRRLCTSIHGPNGNVTYRTYNGAGDTVSIQNADRASRQEYNGNHQPIQITHPNGDTTRFFYNREGLITEVVNEKGERLSVCYDQAGLVTRFDGYDGRRLYYAYDAMGRLVRFTNGLQHSTNYTYDLAGQLVRIEHDDGTIAELEYDCRGQITRASNAGAELFLTRNAAGQITDEEHVIDGQRFKLERTFDALRNRIGLLSSAGYAESVERDVMGRPVRALLDGAELINFEHDPGGRELRRAFSGGAVLESVWRHGALVQRRVCVPETPAPIRPGEPEWVGPRAPVARVSKDFHYSLGGSLLHRWDLDAGDVEYMYDARERVLGVRAGQQIRESYGYDATSNVYETSGLSRIYGPGDRLISKGDARYVWDDDGRLIEKVVQAPDGSERRWTYRWSAANNLERVTRPDGVEVTFTYDLFARRTAKRLVLRGKDGLPSTEVVTRYVWDGDQLLHEVREVVNARGKTVATRRTFVHDREGHPLAQRNAVYDDGGWRNEPWTFFVNDPIGTPEHLVRSNGDVVTRLPRNAWGVIEPVSSNVAWTPLRFSGQYEDPEVGLYYNRYRYYDPDAGRYISADPAGGVPDTNYFRYCVNPIVWTDPFGLGSHDVTATFSNPHSNPPIPAGTPVGSGTANSGPDQRMYDDRYTPNAERYRAKRDEALAQGCSEAEANRRAGMSAHYGERFGDTEAQVMRNAEQQFPNQLAGGTLTMRGDRPPCNFCRGRMAEFAQRNGCSVEYHYPRDPNGPAPHGRGSFTSTGTHRNGVADPTVPARSSWQHSGPTPGKHTAPAGGFDPTVAAQTGYADWRPHRIE